jgi:hypothetical protein
MKLQRLGGYAIFASWIAFIAYVKFASGVFIQPITTKTMAALSSARTEFYLCALFFLISYVLFLVPYAALHERMRADAPCLTRLMLIAASTATVIAIAESTILLKCFGMIIIQQDISAFRACLAVGNGLWFAVNHACGWATLFAGCAILKTRAFSRIVGVLSILSGIVWIPSPFVVEIGFSFIGPIIYALSGIGSIWIGIEMIRQKQFQPESKIMAASR